MPKKNTGVAGEALSYSIPGPAGGVRLETFIPWTLVKHGVKKQVITPIDAPKEFQQETTLERREQKAAQDTPPVWALGLAHYWQRLLDEGKYRSVNEIAAAEGMDLGQVSRIARLARLALSVDKACLVGDENRMTLESLVRRGCRWSGVRSGIG